MKLQTQKLEIISMILQTENPVVVSKMSKLIRKYNSLQTIDNQTTFTPTADEQKAIDEGLEDIRQGKIHTHDDVMKMMQKKYPQLKFPTKREKHSLV